MAQTQTLAGTVTRVTKNRDGFQLDSEPGKYLNLSKQHNPPCPNEGDSVLIQVEAGKWVNSITRQGGAPSVVASGSPSTDPGAGRERLIARQVALKAAIDACGSAGGVPADGYVDSVLALAESFEAWILR